MKKLIILIAVLAMVNIASATVLNFDDIAVTENGVSILDGYGGLPLSWSHIGAAGPEGLKGGYYPKSAVSGDNFAYNGAGQVGTVSALSGTFDFYGAYFTTATKTADTDGDIEVAGYFDGTQVGSTVTIELISLADPVWVDFSLEGIDELVFTPLRTGHGAYWAMDDFTAVPEPMTLCILGLGGLMLRKRKKA